MFKVECPGCKAPYQVDERRVPKSGLKMRCPKCGTSFKVDSPEAPMSAQQPVLGAALGLKGNETARSRAAAAGLKSTMLGVAAPAGLLDDSPKGKPPPPPPRLGRPKPAALPGGPARPAPPLPVKPAPAAPSVYEDPYSEADLPMLGGDHAADAADLPQVRPPPPQRQPREIPSSVELDLPAALPRARAAAADDLPALPMPTRGAHSNELDLPALGGARQSSSGFGPADEMSLELDLPSPSADLPSPAAGADMPLLSLESVLPSGADLPTPASAGLPSAAGRRAGRADLPSRARHADLPSALTAGLPSPAASQRGARHHDELPSVAGELPLPADSLPAPAEVLPSAAESLPSPASSDVGLSLESIPATGDRPSFGELELPLGSDPFATPEPGEDALGLAPFAADPFALGDAAPAAGAPTAPAPRLERRAGGGTSFGEVDLGGGDEPAAEVALEDVRPRQLSQSEEDMEFGAIPQEVPSETAPGTAGASQVRMHVAALPPEAAKSSRGVKIALGLLVLVSVGGGALALVPEVGPFGYYVVSDALSAGEYEKLTERAVADARQLLGQDGFPQAVLAVERVEAASRSAPRVRPLAAYSAFVAFARELRFGSDAAVHARAKVALDALGQAEEVRYRQLAQAALQALDGKPPAARRALTPLLKSPHTRPEAAFVLAELELRHGSAAAAIEAWQSAGRLEKSARSLFGLARARWKTGDLDQAEQLARQTLELQPKHAGAKLLVARVTWERDPGDDTIELLKGVIDERARGLSPQEIVEAHTLLGNSYLLRSRIGLAEEEFSAALKVDPRSAAALRGLGQALYAAARYSEALARFEAAAQAEPGDLAVQLGLVKCKLVLERVKEAAALAEDLRNAHPDSARAALWHGHALEALGNRQQAEAAYRKAVQLSDKDANAVETYVALSMLQSQMGKLEEARELLDKARNELPKSARTQRALGDVALAQGRYEDALRDYDQALELDPSDLLIQFQRGVTLRRSGQLERAGEAFEAVANVDRDYPGLALERGLLHEAAGRSDEALKAYEAALAKAPEDPDLMLRVGCSNAAAGRAKQAEKLLRKVLEQRPNSAETNHCLGRALLLDPSRLSDAMRSLERAVSIDPNRPEYHLYVGWAANEVRDFKKAHKSLERALALDQSLADAYWQRGVLLSRQGAVKDAIADLDKALELRPSRHEAYAALADAYYDLGREPEALAAWQRATRAMPREAAWRFRYGKLLLANRQTGAAVQELGQALEIVKNEEPKPRWSVEAHLLLAQALGRQQAAVEHWQAYLQESPKQSPYRPEALKALKALGHPWKGD